MPVISTLIPLLAFVAPPNPSTQPPRDPAGPARASAAASITIVPAARVGCCRAGAGAIVEPDVAVQERERMVIREGLPAGIRYDFEFE